MKRNLLVLLCIALSFVAFGQQKIEEVKVTPPSFTGIEDYVNIKSQTTSKTIGEFLNDNFEYPFDKGMHYQGVVVVEFIVNTEGKLSDFVVINSVGNHIDEEIIRLLKKTDGMWSPGSNNGEPVAMKKEVPMQIRTGYRESGTLKTDFKAIAAKSFTKGSSALLEKQKAKRALRHYNKAMTYAPYEKSLFIMRGLCKYEIGDTDGAREDWIRLKELGGIDMELFYFAGMIDLKGYEEMAFILMGK